MLWWIIASLFSAVNIVFYKKVLVCAGSHKLTSPWLLWMMNIELAGVMLMVYFLIPNIVPINFSLVHGDIYLLWFILLSTLLGITSELMSQYAYKNKKISILTPFWEFGQIMTIILGFLIFSETSVTTFVFAIIAASALIISSINFHIFYVNRYCMVLGFSGFMRALATIVVGYVLLQITPLTFISIDVTIVSILLLFFYYYHRNFLFLFRIENHFYLL